MRYLLPILVFSLLFSGFSFLPALAQDTTTEPELISEDKVLLDEEEVDLPEPGLTPDSPVYFLDGLFKSVRLTFAFSSARKADLRLEFAQEKLAEAKLMADEGREEALEEALEKYQNHVEKTQERVEKLKDKTKDRVAERVADATSKHFSVLERVREKAPERAKEALLRARDASEAGHLEAIRALSDAKADKAAEFTALALKKRLQLAQRKADANVDEEDDSVREVERFERFAEFAEELKIRHRDGDTDLRARIESKLDGEAAQRDTTLRRVRDKVPAQARDAINQALQKSDRIRVPRDKDTVLRDAEEKKIERKLEFEERKTELKLRNETRKEDRQNEVRSRVEEKVEIRDDGTIRTEVKERLEDRREDLRNEVKTETRTLRPRTIDRIKVDENTDGTVTIDNDDEVIIEVEPKDAPQDVPIDKGIELNDVLPLPDDPIRVDEKGNEI